MKTLAIKEEQSLMVDFELAKELAQAVINSWRLYDGILDQSKCTHCQQVSDDANGIKHTNSCIVPTAKNLLG